MPRKMRKTNRVRAMIVTHKISRASLKDKKYKERETKKTGTVPESRDAEALAELLKALKKS